MTRIPLAMVGLAVLAIVGCASSLKTFTADGTRTLGIPVATPVLVRITETTHFVADPANPHYRDYCVDDTSSRYEVLAVGERIYVAFDPAPLGKGEFKVELTSAGALKLVSLNSEATSGADEIGDLLAAVLPFVAAPKPEPAGLRPSDETAQQIKARYCLKTGTEVIRIERVEVANLR